MPTIRNPSNRTSRLLVLCWHNVEGTWCFPARPGTGRRGLARQLRALRTLASVVPLRPALARLRAGRPLPPRAVALTFDDGYADNLSLAVPMLERLRLPATFFLVPGLLSGESRAWWEVTGWAFARSTSRALAFEGTDHSLATPGQRRAAYLAVGEALKRRDQRRREAATAELVASLAPTGPRPGGEMWLDWDGAAALVTRGFAVGSHTCHHAILPEETAAEQERDLASARYQLESRLGTEVDLLAYPNGTRQDFDDVTIAAAQRTGYQAALTTVDGFIDRRTPAYEVRRSVVYPQRGPLELALALRDAWRG